MLVVYAQGEVLSMAVELLHKELTDKILSPAIEVHCQPAHKILHRRVERRHKKNGIMINGFVFLRDLRVSCVSIENTKTQKIQICPRVPNASLGKLKTN